MNLQRTCVALTLALAFNASVSLAEWTAPADNKLTDKQMQSYVGTMNDLREMWTTQGKKLDNASTLGAIAIGSQIGDKWQAILAKHNLSEAEWTWVHEQATRSWLVQGMISAAEADLGKQKKDINDRIAAAKQKLAEQEEALKSGKRTVRDDERPGMIEDFTNQQKNALEEAAGYDEQAKRAADEAKEYTDAAATAERQMKSPPADVTGDDRAAYVDEQKAEAATNRERATEARARETEAKEAAAGARTRAANFAKQVADPTLVLDGEELAALKEQRQMDIDSTRSEIARQERLLADLAPMEATNNDILKQMREGIPQENLDLAKKYSDQIAAAFGNETQK